MYVHLLGTYDVQSVSGRAISGGLELSCTYAEESQAQSCILEICNSIITNGSCRNVIIARGSQLSDHTQPGMYTVTVVGEIEKNGEITSIKIHDNNIPLQYMIIVPPLVTTLISPGINHYH